MMGSILDSALVCLLLSSRAAWAALVVTVPYMGIQARPGSDAQLPCFFSDSSRLIDIKQLAVIWKVGSETIAKYRNTLEVYRPGAVIAGEQLPMGNATLLLQGVKKSDAAVYTCLVIHVPESGEGTVELRVEAPPRLSIRRTKLYLGQPSVLTCTVSGFYPSNISVTWLRGSEVLRVCQLRPAQAGLDGLFGAQCILDITPQVADAKANFSCQVRHQALERHLQEDFQLKVLAPPSLQVFTVPEEKTFCAARCVVSGFYPKEIQVEWLRNQVPVPQQNVTSQSELIPDGTYTVQKVILLEGSKTKMNYICRVKHEALDAPMEQNVLWQPKSEGSPESPPESPAKSYSVFIALAIALFILGFLLGVLAVYLYNRKRAQNKAVPAKKTENALLTEKSQWISEDGSKRQSGEMSEETRGIQL